MNNQTINQKINVNIDNIENELLFFEEPEKSYDIVFSFDTTPSMTPCIEEVRKNLTGLVARLFNDIRNLRVGVIAHGDYENEGQQDSYLMEYVDLTNNKLDIMDFIKYKAKNTKGNDFPEAYEYVLHKSQNLSWEADIKILVMIGDAKPHEPTAPKNKLKLDWKNETKILHSMGINVYSVRCRDWNSVEYFYKGLAELSKGYYLQLKEFSSISDLILTVCYKQVDDEVVRKFEREMELEGRMNLGMRKVVDTVLERNTNTNINVNVNSGYVNLGNIVVAEPSKEGARFDILDVNENCSLKDYMHDKKITFDSGKLYNEIKIPKLINNNENIVVMNKENGNIYEGKESFKVLGMRKNFVKRQRLIILPNYRTFIECKNRIKLEENTKLLYEKKDVIVI